MNVAEFITKLQALPPELPVLVDGYEGGLIEAQAPYVTPIVFNFRDCEYEGPHEELENVSAMRFEDDPAPTPQDAVIISRNPIFQ